MTKREGEESTKRPADPVGDTARAPAADATLPAPPRPVGAEDARTDYPEFITVSAEHYVLDKEVARGGMGRIRVARDRRLGRLVAVKEIIAAAGEASRRFAREARITARLQHPSIVNVYEAGVWPSGEPFYAMKLVSGRSLDDVIGDARSPEERLALLPNVLAVADGMAYAHSQRVIHRDLKPKNVLVGAFGETVIIDWGLAKDLAAASGVEEAARDSAPAGRGADTAIGDVMGTPAYMPPEQAEGRSVDERADVYAIGAMLDHALSGRPAYTGKSAVEILDTVKRGPPAPLAERQTGVPPDLLAIVERAMARDPAARYPSARELADDLRRYQTGQLVGAHRYSLAQLLRRWLRRHRSAVAVAGVATVVLIVLGAVALERILSASRRAEKQRAIAEASRGDAEDLVGFMLNDLNNKLQPLGRLELLDDVARKAVAYYERREDLTAAQLEKRALALRNLGDVLAGRGRLEPALKEYRAALAIGEELLTREPDNPRWQREVSAAHTSVGRMLILSGQSTGALAECRTALAIAEGLAARFPDDVARLRDLAVAHGQLAKVLSVRGDTAGALAEQRQELVVDETIARKDPLLGQRDLAGGHEALSWSLGAHGDTAGALAEVRTAVASWQALLARDPENANWLYKVGQLRARVGDLLQAQGDTLGALEEYRAILPIRERLAARDPTNVDWQRDLFTVHWPLGQILLAQGDAKAALAEYRLALEAIERLAAKEPGNTNWQRDLATGHEAVGTALRALGDARGALAELETALELTASLAARDPANSYWQRGLAALHDSIGDVLIEQGDVPRALTEYRAAFAAWQALAVKDPANAVYAWGVASDHGRVGEALLRAGDARGALAQLRPGLATAEALSAADPTNATLQHDMVDFHGDIGDALAALGDPGAARAEYQAGLAIARRFVAKLPGNAYWKQAETNIDRKLAACCAPRR